MRRVGSEMWYNDVARRMDVVVRCVWREEEMEYKATVSLYGEDCGT
jgi:hypothetical protein